MKKILPLFFAITAITSVQAQKPGDILKNNSVPSTQQTYTPPVEQKDFADEYSPTTYPGWQYEKPGTVLLFNCPVTRNVDALHFYNWKPKAWVKDGSGNILPVAVLLKGMAIPIKLDQYFLTSGKWVVDDPKEQTEKYRYLGPISLTGGSLQLSETGQYEYIITFN